MKQSQLLKSQILSNVVDYYYETQNEKEPFISGKTKVNYSGRVYDYEELVRLVDAALDFKLTGGEWIDKFEKSFSYFLKVKYSHFCNSGSSANFLAFMSLTSAFWGDKRIKRGDEVITTACCFPTTISPIIQYGAIPVFVDCDLHGNINVKELKKALSDKTKAVMIAHTLGVPFDLTEVQEFCKANNLWLIEDTCDALGSKYNDQYVGTFGDVATCSFYPAHHITTGEGGMVFTNNLEISAIIQSFRDWGRNYQCTKCVPNCKKRFDQTIKDYDCRYTYSHFGYNLKGTELQAAIGFAQMKKLEYFIDKRKQNYIYIFNKLEKVNNLLFNDFSSDPKRDISPFGFTMITDDRNELFKYLEDHGIEARMLFAGNILKQPCMQDDQIKYRTIGALHTTEYLMNSLLWIGVYPGMTKEMLDYMCDTILNFYKEK